LREKRRWEQKSTMFELLGDDRMFIPSEEERTFVIDDSECERYSGIDIRGEDQILCIDAIEPGVILSEGIAIDDLECLLLHSAHYC